MDVDGVRLRYVVAGTGPTLVLVHTLRTQLDLFQRLLPLLTERCRVYALDLPGHRYSDIPAVDYTADLFIGKIAGFIEALDLQDVTLVGESIGATSALGLAARRHPRVGSVVAINAYDYDGGRGVGRGSLIARLVFSTNDVPVLGGTIARLRSYPVVKAILNGGLHRLASMPAELAREIYRVGNRRGHYQAFTSLVHHWPSWERERERYGLIERPVLLIYGDHDWSRTDERAETARRITGARVMTVERAGHFLAFEAPRDAADAITAFVDGVEAAGVGERYSS